MQVNDLLVTTAQSDQQFSACLWDYKTLNVHKYYKNGGSVATNCFELIGKDYFLSGELGKPLLHLWLLNSQDVLRNIRLILPEPANCLAVCPNSTYLAAGINCKVYLWHMSSGKLLSVLHKNFQPITSIKFSSDGNFLLIGGHDGMLINYCMNDIVTLSSNFSLQREIGKVDPLYIKRDHSMTITSIHVGLFNRFATVSIDKTCRLYTLLTGELLFSLVFANCLTTVIFDSWFSSLYVGLDNGNIQKYNLKVPPKSLTHHIEETSCVTLSGHTAKVVAIALNISQTILASGSLDCFVYTWDVQKNQILKKIKHNSPITNIMFVKSYHNFFAETLKPEIIIKSLERSIDRSTGLVVAKVQRSDKYVEEDDFQLSQESYINSLVKENSRLRIVNKTFYDTAVELSKKVYL